MVGPGDEWWKNGGKDPLIGLIREIRDDLDGALTAHLKAQKGSEQASGMRVDIAKQLADHPQPSTDRPLIMPREVRADEDPAVERTDESVVVTTVEIKGRGDDEWHERVVGAAKGEEHLDEAKAELEDLEMETDKRVSLAPVFAGEEVGVTDGADLREVLDGAEIAVGPGNNEAEGDDAADAPFPFETTFLPGTVEDLDDRAKRARREPWFQEYVEERHGTEPGPRGVKDEDPRKTDGRSGLGVHGGDRDPEPTEGRFDEPENETNSPGTKDDENEEFDWGVQ